MTTLQAIKWENGKLEILDQILLPAISRYIPVRGVEDGWKVINNMQVRCFICAFSKNRELPSFNVDFVRVKRGLCTRYNSKITRSNVPIDSEQ